MNAPNYTAQEYIGYILDDDVQHGILLRAERKSLGLDDPSGFYPDTRQIETWKLHFRPGCICRRFHDQCYLSSDLDRVDDKPHDGTEGRNQQTFDLLSGVTMQHLQDAAKAGCWFCSIVHKGMEPALQRFKGTGLSDDACKKLYIKAEKPSANNIGRPLLRVALISSVKTGNTSLRYEFYSQGGQDQSHICACFRTSPDIPLSTALPESFLFAKYQLAKCMQSVDGSHIHCETGEVELPTRVLDITALDGKYHIRLLITNGIRGKYIALSHCRGSKKHATTTVESLGERQVNIPWECLSKSFRDAIHITHRLGYRYLWIDALCILQGDSIDWQQESARMHLVYQNCSLMISVDKARDGDGGCFSNLIGGVPWVVEGSPQDMKIAVRPAKYHQGVFGPNRAGHSSIQAPLTSRAWAFQERTLARRILHFTNDELLWECGGMYVCQCGDFHSISGVGNNASKFIFQTCNLGDYVDHVWLGLVADYSARSLTFPEDRLPGFSGLAKQYMSTWKELIERQRGQKVSGSESNVVPQLTGRTIREQTSKDSSIVVTSLPKDLGDYVAGMWSNYLDIMLQWARPFSNFPLVAKPAKYIAPSWSWASINSNIIYMSRRQKMRNISIKAAVCTVSGMDPTGAVKDGYLLVSGSSIMLVLTWKSLTLESVANTSCGYYALSDYARRDVSENYMPDYLLPIEETNESSCPTLTVYGLIMSPDFVMVLRKVPDQDAYERIGSLSFGLQFYKDQPAMWSQDALEMTMKIV